MPAPSGQWGSPAPPGSPSSQDLPATLQHPARHPLSLDPRLTMASTGAGLSHITLAEQLRQHIASVEAALAEVHMDTELRAMLVGLATQVGSLA